MDTTEPTRQLKFNRLSNAQYFEARKWAEENVETLRSLKPDQLSATASEALGFFVGLGSAQALRSDLGWNKPLPTPESSLVEMIDELEKRMAVHDARLASLEARITASEQRLL